MRLVVVGGSGASTPELFEAIAHWPGGAGRRPDLEVVLQGRNDPKLRLVAAESRRRLPDGATVRVVAEPDLGRALEGAVLVLVQVRVGGLDARRFDETFPRAFGIPGEETMGPGGFANAIRTAPALAPVWDRIASDAPGALVLNLTNPAGIVTRAAIARTGLRMVSVCESPTAFAAAVASAVGTAPPEVESAYVGSNHAGFWAGGTAASRRLAVAAANGIDEDDVDVLHALPAPYLRYYLHPERQLEAQLSAPEPRADGLQRLERITLDQYAGAAAGTPQVVQPAAPDAGPARREAPWYALGVVPLIDAIVNGSREPLIVGLPNQDRVPWAPVDATIEGPTDVLAGGELRPRRTVDLPARAASLMERHAEYETATAAAIAAAGAHGPDRAALVQALMVNPMVSSRWLAERLVDAILAMSPDPHVGGRSAT
jgi:6-phospho-beta-glucosidase